jgi:photosystem II stability/assembly factor-like uncharacterized protein
MHPDDVARAVDALISRVPAPAVDAASTIARGHERIVRRRVVLTGVSVALLATIATAGAIANSHHTRNVASPAPTPAPTTTTRAPVTPTTAPTPEGTGDRFVGIAAASSLEAWKCVEPLQYTSDGGRTWRAVTPANPTTVENLNPVCTAVAAGNAWAVETTNDPPPANILRVGRGVVRAISSLPPLPAISVLAGLTFFDANHGWVLIAHGSSLREDLYRTLDGGNTWALVAHNQPVGYGEVFTSATRGWARNSDQVLTTFDSGATWRAVTLPAAPHVVGFRPELYQVVARGRSVVVWRGNWNGTVFEPFFDVSSDEGHTWSQRRGPNGLQVAGNANSLFDAADARHLRFFSGERLWISDDGGRTWTRRPRNLAGAYVQSISFPTADVGWIMGRTRRSSPSVLRTADAGRTWNDVTNGRPPPGGIVGCPTRPLTPAPAGDPPPGVVSAAIAYEDARAVGIGGTVTAVYRVGYVGAGAFGNTFRDNVTSCGPAVARATWVVEFGATAVVLAHYADGWHVFGRNQPFTS